MNDEMEPSVISEHSTKSVKKFREPKVEFDHSDKEESLKSFSISVPSSCHDGHGSHDGMPK